MSKRNRRRIVDWSKVPASTYAGRDAMLFWLGYPSYADYLRSDLWRTIRKRILVRDGNRCCVCHGKASEVHHAAYTRAAMLGQEDEQLLSLCRDCHKGIEFTPGGSKRRLAEVGGKRIRRRPPKPQQKQAEYKPETWGPKRRGPFHYDAMGKLID